MAEQAPELRHPPTFSRRRLLQGAGTAAGGLAAYLLLRNIESVGDVVDTVATGGKPQSLEEKFPEVLLPSQFQAISSAEFQNLYISSSNIDIPNRSATIGFPLREESTRDNSDLRISRSSLIFSEDPQNEGIKNVVNITGVKNGSEVVSPIDGYAFLISISDEVNNTGLGKSSGTPYTMLFIMSPHTDNAQGRYGISLEVRGGMPDTNIPYQIPTDVTFDVEKAAKVKAGQLMAIKGMGKENEPDVVIKSDYTTFDGPRATIMPIAPKFLSTASGSIAITSSS